MEEYGIEKSPSSKESTVLVELLESGESDRIVSGGRSSFLHIVNREYRGNNGCCGGVLRYS